MMKPAVFLDRDGVICSEKGYITSFEDMEIFPFAKEAVNIIKEKGYKVIVITNQSAVARGLIDVQGLETINSRLSGSVPVDGIYYCPHYPPDGKDIPPYIINCNCRKPQPGLILKAAYEHCLDLSGSYFVGDRESDILAGKNAGTLSTLVLSGFEKNPPFNFNVDYVFNNLLEFASFLPHNRE